jgi:hypothetical protein
MSRYIIFLILYLFLSLTTGCLPQDLSTPIPTPMEPLQAPTIEDLPSESDPDIPERNSTMTPSQQSQYADVLSVQVTGNPSNYQFAVQVASPDTGCEQFADWWEVFDENGQLVYRRILLHSHVGEQPFTRSGGPVEIAADEVVYVRAHMNTVGYGGLLMKGTVQAGFKPVEVDADFGFGLERIPPQPEDCAF